ncbi:hypothetical protein FHS56_000957 [Thermonema lapsum]|uniref:Uncharacterized protein n=1 Tax=Thermonema lapsum TaxID=28195 RepID=A0A846MPW3_9BACT|nr:hypothetical protein [Thermonema lapsum]
MKRWQPTARQGAKSRLNEGHLGNINQKSHDSHQHQEFKRTTCPIFRRNSILPLPLSPLLHGSHVLLLLLLHVIPLPIASYPDGRLPQ